MIPQKPRSIFWGNPDFVIPVAEVTTRLTDLQMVIANPDKPKGRGGKLSPTPIKIWAETNRLTVLAPERLNEPKILEKIRSTGAELFVVAAYGKIIPKEILEIPRFGAINIHPSLLPRWRGAAPVVHTILAGDKETGVTIILLTEEMDAGPILARKTRTLFGQETTGFLNQELFQRGAEIFEDILSQYLPGVLKPVPQPPEGITYAPKVKPVEAHLIWTKSGKVIEREIRAFNPEPGSYFLFERKGKLLRIKVWSARIENYLNIRDKIGFGRSRQGFPAVAASEGLIILTSLQPEGKKILDGKGFVNGYPEFIGSQLC